MTRIRIGTRGSLLALAQSNWVKAQLMQNEPALEVELRIIKTSGDRLIDTPIQNLGGKGVFTKEIEQALLRDEIDLAVHSMKDLPAQLPAGLVIAAVPKREDPRDVLVTREKRAFAELPSGTTIGTGSLRRQAQLLNKRRDLAMVPMRGNVDTRLRKLDEGQVNALVMAAAGLKRIGRADRIGEYLADEVCVSAVAQGALGVESRKESLVGEHLRFLHDPATCSEVAAERALLDRLGGDCYVPIGARARLFGSQLKLTGVVASPDGSRLCRGEISGHADAAAELGQRLAEELLKQGAVELLGAK
ncbi:MAG: hydroxymethylbilane synthase [Candidatus Binatia bacterium]